MKKFYLFLMSLIMFGGLNAQTLVNQNFDSYPAGTLFVQADTNSLWMLDYGEPGDTTYDVRVVNDTASSPENALRIQDQSQLVLFMGDKDYGKHRVSFDVFVYDGMEAFVAICNKYQNFSLPWALMFNSNGELSLMDYVNGGDSAIGTFEHNKWWNFSAIIDVDKDSVYYYKDNVLLYAHQWSNNGSYGIGAFCFIGVYPGIKWNMDNVEYYQYPTSNPPVNLTAVPNENYVTLTWDPAPGTTPDYYVVKRNGIVVNNHVASTTFTDTGLFPRTYSYTISSHIPDVGTTPPSSPVEATITGGIDRKYVLFEIATGTWCQYCPGAGLGLDDLITNGQQVVGVEYHWGDDFENPAGKSRVDDYYQIGSFPTAMIDGIYTYSGGNHSQSLYDTYLPLYNTAMSVKTVADLSINSIVKVNDSLYSATIVASKQWPFFNNSVQLRTALVESNIEYNWQGQTELDYVCRGMYPDATGITLNFANGSEFTQQVEFVIPSGAIKDNYEFICFLQDDNVKEVLNADKTNIAHVGISEKDKKDGLHVYPNPANDVLYFQTNGKGIIHIYSLAGVEMKKITVSNAIESISTSDLPAGVYFLKYETQTTYQTMKIIIK